jgi:hypothetical protein
MLFLLTVDSKDMVLTEHQLDTVMSILDTCEELYQVYKGDKKGSRGDRLQYEDELRPLDPRGVFNVKPLPENYYETLKLVAKLAKPN